MKPLNLPVEKLFKVLMRYKYLILVIVVGLVLILWPSGGSSSSTVSEDGEYSSFAIEEMEKKLETALGAVEGAGRVKVILTLHSDMHIILQEDVTAQSSRSMEDGVMTEYDTSSQRKTVVVNSGSAQQPVVTRRLYPEYEGALIVCDGGDSATIRLKVSEAVSALTGLGSDKITILKMKQ